jgi:hypothetical protein
MRMGPKIRPIKPNSLSPTITPNIVINGWVSPIFFSNQNLKILSTDPTIINPYNNKKTPHGTCPLYIKTKASGIYTNMAPRNGTKETRKVTTNQRKGSSTPAIQYPSKATKL